MLFYEVIYSKPQIYSHQHSTGFFTFQVRFTTFPAPIQSSDRGPRDSEVLPKRFLIGCPFFLRVAVNGEAEPGR